MRVRSQLAHLRRAGPSGKRKDAVLQQKVRNREPIQKQGLGRANRNLTEACAGALVHRNNIDPWVNEHALWLE